MKLSSTTITILKNLALFNNHIVVDAGNVLKTVNEKKTTFIKMTVEEEFPVEFALHDLNGFLKVLSLFDEPELTFDDKLDYVVISDGSGSSQKYYFSDKENLIYETREVNMPPADVEVGITSELLNKVIKGAAVNGVEDIAVVGEGGKVYLRALDKENPKRTFQVTLSDEDLGEFTVYLKHSKKGANKLNLLPFDYIVSISAAKIIEFSATVEGIEASYIMAIEQDSII